MSKTIHFFHGCPWADGSIQSADTNQQFSWNEVTCMHCWRYKKADNTSVYWKNNDRQHFDSYWEYVNSVSDKNKR